MFRYGIAIAVVTVALLIRIALVPVAHDHAPYLSFAPAVLIASALGGLGPGVLATFTSSLAVLATLENFPALGIVELVNATAFTIVGSGMGWLGGRLRRIGLHATEAAKELSSREAHLKSILETVPEAVIIIDERGLIQSFSATAERLFEYTADEAIGQNVCILMPPPDRERHDEYIQSYLRSGERKIIGMGRSVVARRKGGLTFPVELAVAELKSGGRHYFIGFVRDLTEREKTDARLRELQSELTHVSRLNAMGEMGSTIAHELNQPLSAIANYLQGSLRLLNGAEDGRSVQLRTALERSAEQALRAGQVIRRLREFLARRDGERRVESVRALVEEASALALIGVKELGIRICFEFAPQADAVLVDKVQIQQVLLNLMRNAIEAMEQSDRRELTISTFPAEDGMVGIAVSDTGCGIASEMSDRLFQPFATSKPHGMGIGLSISRNIVEAHGGQILAERNSDGGTVFRFTLRAISMQELEGVD